MYLLHRIELFIRKIEKLNRTELMIIRRTIMVETLIHFIFPLLKLIILVRIEFFAQLINIKFFHSTSSNLSPTHHSKSNLLKRNDRERIRDTGLNHLSGE